jgi:hypothetical protein
MVEKINLTEKLSLFGERRSPKIVAELNDMQVKVVKVEGEFLWHHHDQEDEPSSSSRAGHGCSFATATSCSSPAI